MAPFSMVHVHLTISNDGLLFDLLGMGYFPVGLTYLGLFVVPSMIRPGMEPSVANM